MDACFNFVGRIGVAFEDNNIGIHGAVTAIAVSLLRSQLRGLGLESGIRRKII